jgi:type IX secretion system PorP/SprF family membrane protein
MGNAEHSSSCILKNSSMKIKLNQLLLLMLLLPLALAAQDFHLSQIDAAPHYFNPALTGMYLGDKGDYRFYSDYRTQWRSFGIKPFSTFYLAGDMPFKDQFGLGGYLISNRNGAGGLNTIQFMPSGAYRVTKDPNGEHQLSVGAQMGILYKTFDPNRYTYEPQFSPDAPEIFDPSISNGENFAKVSLLKFDAAMGVFYKYNKTDWKAHPFLGYSVYHVSRPSQTFTGNGKDKLPMRWVYQFGADWKVNDQISVKPMILYMLMAKAHELNIGATGSYLLKETDYTILGGLNYRAKDAFIIQAGMKFAQHIFMLSYDINTSSLNNYTNGNGAFEISIKLTGIKGTPLFNPKFSGNRKNKSL